MTKKILIALIALIYAGCFYPLNYQSSSFLIKDINGEPIRFYERNILLTRPKNNLIEIIYDLGRPVIFLVTHIRDEFNLEKGVCILVERSEFLNFYRWINQIKRKKSYKENFDLNDFMKRAEKEKEIREHK